jgi:hypothetical protein
MVETTTTEERISERPMTFELGGMKNSDYKTMLVVRLCIHTIKAKQTY